jgi:hypothetical protein
MTAHTSVSTSLDPTDDVTRVRSNRFWAGAWRRFRRNKLALFGAVYVVIIFFVAVFAPLVAPYPFDRIEPLSALEGPSIQHPMGLDMLGRDMLSRIIYGARPMLLVGVVTQLAGLLIGVPLGIVAGYMGGAVDWLVSRLVDLFSALPWYLIVLYMVMVLSPSLENLIIALTITSWVTSCRIRARDEPFDPRAGVCRSSPGVGHPYLADSGQPYLPAGGPAAAMDVRGRYTNCCIRRSRAELPWFGGSPAKPKLGPDAGPGRAVLAVLPAYFPLPIAHDHAVRAGIPGACRRTARSDGCQCECLAGEFTNHGSAA